MTDQDTTRSEKTPFDASKHLSTVKGQDYLEVKWRVVWFREEWPFGRIETEIIDVNPEYAVVKATVIQVADGGEISGSSTGMGMAEKRTFDSYVEKAETKAVGRALAMLGYGTQFTESGDFNYANSNGVQGAPPDRNRNSTKQARPAPVSNPKGPAVEQQLKAIRIQMEKLGWTTAKLESFIKCQVTDLNYESAGRLINDLDRMVKEGMKG